MGVTWVTRFTASFTKNAVFWYIFVILNSLQGVFIFLSFVLTKKVYRLITKKQASSISTGNSSSKSEIRMTLLNKGESV